MGCGAECYLCGRFSEGSISRRKRSKKHYVRRGAGIPAEEAEEVLVVGVAEPAEAWAFWYPLEVVRRRLRHPRRRRGVREISSYKACVAARIATWVADPLSVFLAKAVRGIP